MVINMQFTEIEVQELIDSVLVWHHRIEVAPGVFTPGAQWTDALLLDIDLPEDLSGMRVLDLGARDGFFSFECEKRGATEVIAVDYSPMDLTGFGVAREILNSKVKWITSNVYKINELNLGKFDLILFLLIFFRDCFCNKHVWTSSDAFLSLIFFPHEFPMGARCRLRLHWQRRCRGRRRQVACRSWK